MKLLTVVFLAGELISERVWTVQDNEETQVSDIWQMKYFIMELSSWSSWL